MNRWKLVQELFEETAGLEADRRARILAARSAGDASLEREVERLVAADATPPDALDRGVTALLGALSTEPDPDELCGAAFGAYRVEEHLSSGGMGHVYRAVRTTAGTERRVALKVLRPGLDTEAFLERFRSERKTLAGLEHEHVVAFLDAGALPDGRPFLVMELVEGQPLTEWGKGRSLREKLALFGRVLGAVQYAHQKLVVHRDLKPSNVLVTAQGTPRLLDFGVARMLTSEGGASEREPLTPGYASPEQRRGEPPTTAGDVYSLGVLLHELVTGERPTASRVPLRGDLGAVVRKATDSDPARRHASADLLAEDVRRVLAREPVSARAPGWCYRAVLFARRNPWPLVLTSSVVLALIAGWIAADLGRRDARQEASIGWGAHSQAKVAARVFEGWIVAAASEDAALASAAARHLEDALAGELATLPEAETLVRIALAELYLRRDELERAGEHARRAAGLAAATRGVGAYERERARALLESIATARHGN